MELLVYLLLRIHLCHVFTDIVAGAAFALWLVRPLSVPGRTSLVAIFVAFFMLHLSGFIVGLLPPHRHGDSSARTLRPRGWHFWGTLLCTLVAIGACLYFGVMQWRHGSKLWKEAESTFRPTELGRPSRVAPSDKAVIHLLLRYRGTLPLDHTQIELFRLDQPLSKGQPVESVGTSVPVLWVEDHGAGNAVLHLPLTGAAATPESRFVLVDKSSRPQSVIMSLPIVSLEAQCHEMKR